MQTVTIAASVTFILKERESSSERRDMLLVSLKSLKQEFHHRCVELRFQVEKTYYSCIMF